MIFNTLTYGKWILCGEQSVLRGHPAIVFPLGNYRLNLSYTSTDQALEIICQPEHQSSVRKVWKQAWSKDNPPDFVNKGILRIESSIPIGQGMGASAALCLAIARMVCQVSHTPDNIWREAKALEHLFHGQSSGLDILGSNSQQGAWFERGQSHPIHMTWRPKWLLTNSNEIGETAKAIQKVQTLCLEKPSFAKSIDNLMHDSVLLAKQALASAKPEITLLQRSMNQSRQCFEDWGLITPNMQKTINFLFQQGALAVKPTGSGGGGYLLSLWSDNHIHLMPKGEKHLQITLPIDRTIHQT